MTTFMGQTIIMTIITSKIIIQSKQQHKQRALWMGLQDANPSSEEWMFIDCLQIIDLHVSGLHLMVGWKMY